MKTLVFFSLLIGFLFHNQLTAQARAKSFPTPPASATRLFYIQRSNDANTVIYDANMLSNKKLDPNKPVQVYWIRYAEQGQREDLSSMQWRMAYGYKHSQASNQANDFDICLNAFRKRSIKIVSQQGRPVALATINGRNACLQKIFVQLAPQSGFIPRVQYIEMFGVDPEHGQTVYERITL